MRLLGLVILGAGGWAGYRAFKANQKGVPLDKAFKRPFTRLELLKSQPTGPSRERLVAPPVGPR